MFNIPMKTKGALNLSNLASMNGQNRQPEGWQDQQPMGYQNRSMPQQNRQYSGTPQPVVQSPNRQFGQQNWQNTGMPQPVVQSPNGQYGQPVPQPIPRTYNSQQPYGGVPRSMGQGGGVHLRKGQKFALAGAGGAQLNAVRIGLGWDVLNRACDLDASVFMLDSYNRVVGDDWFVFYGQTTSPDGSVVHSGDSDGSGIGDDETITIDLRRVNPNVQKLTFVVTINEALTQGLNFSMVANAYVRVIDMQTNMELARFSLTDYYANVTSMIVGELYRYNGAWKFNAVGDGVAKDLYGLCAMYGVNVAD